jgi:carbon-monoxide dehydrogenase small subunit/xanthine dehydrogenase YagT iron-sulfur-binding subunit
MKTSSGPGNERSGVALGTPRRVKRVVLNVNGQDHELDLRAKTTLAEALREHLGLIGTKVGCNRAECGSCMVIVDEKAVFACAILAVEAGGKRIETIEGLAKGGKLHPVQEAFIHYDALQCGICIPGMVMSVKALLDQNINPTEADVAEAIGGNLCRCGTYPNTVRATLAAARVLRGEEV